MVKVKFIKDFANRKAGEFFECSSQLASQLINHDQVAELADEEEVKVSYNQLFAELREANERLNLLEGSEAVEQLETQLKEANDSLEDSKKALEEKETQLKEANDSLEDVNSKLKTTEASLKKAQAELKKLKAQA